MRKIFGLILGNDMRKWDRNFVWELVMRWENEKDIWFDSTVDNGMRKWDRDLVWE